jgi:spore photoproduct lyase
VTKFNHVDPYLGLKHNGHTIFRFSINSKYVISQFEHNTSSYEERIEAASKIASAGYPIGFIIAPIMRHENWEEAYLDLLTRLSENLKGYGGQVPFELIQHRFTKTAKELILQRFPGTKLDLEEESRQLKWGPYGKFKYVYKKEESNEIKEFFEKNIVSLFNNGIIEYFT